MFSAMLQDPSDCGAMGTDAPYLVAAYASTYLGLPALISQTDERRRPSSFATDAKSHAAATSTGGGASSSSFHESQAAHTIVSPAEALALRLLAADGGAAPRHDARQLLLAAGRAAGFIADPPPPLLPNAVAEAEFAHQRAIEESIAVDRREVQRMITSHSGPVAPNGTVIFAAARSTDVESSVDPHEDDEIFDEFTPLAEAHTPADSVHRGFEDIDFVKYALYTFVLCGLRTAILHPCTIVVARKQLCEHSAKMSAVSILRRMYRQEGGVRAFRQGMLSMVIGMALSETVYTSVYEAGRFALRKVELGQLIGWSRGGGGGDVAATFDDEASVADALLERATGVSVSSGDSKVSPEEAEAAAALDDGASADASAAYAADFSSRVLFSPFLVVSNRQMTLNSRTGRGLAEKWLGQSATVAVASSANSLRQTIVNKFRNGATASSATVHGGPILSSHVSPLGVATTRLAKEHPSTMSVIRATVQAGGVKALFSGLGITLVFGGCWSAVFWVTYNRAKESLYSGLVPRLAYYGDDAPAPASPACDGVGVTSSSRARSRTDGETASSVAGAGLECDEPVDVEGTVAAQLAAFEAAEARRQRASFSERALRRVLPTCVTSSTDNFVANSIASWGASAIAAFVFNPYVVVRTRLQTDHTASLRSVMRDLFVKQNPAKGVRSLFQGVAVTAGSAIIDGWLMSTTYEYAKQQAALPIKRPQPPKLVLAEGDMHPRAVRE